MHNAAIVLQGVEGDTARGPVCDRKFVSTFEERSVEKEIVVRMRNLIRRHANSTHICLPRLAGCRSATKYMSRCRSLPQYQRS